MIEEYKPGIITIDGRDYTRNIETDWNGEILSWERVEDNVINVNDLERALEKEPETIVVGTGEELIRLPKEAEKRIKEAGIKLILDKTEEAVKTFNILKEDSLEEEGRQIKVVGLFIV